MSDSTITRAPLPTSRPSPRRALRIALFAAIGLAAVFIITLPAPVAGRDFITYWSAGRLLLHHADPYSISAVTALEKSQGSTITELYIMRNPPWALFLALPLGFFPARLGLVLWTLANVGCILASIRLLKAPSKDAPFAFVFAPGIAAIFCGQSAPFLLLGFALFLRFYRSRPFLAGASLLLMAIKPHLFLAFWLVLLIDCVYRKTFSILAGGAASLAAACALAMFFDPHVWAHYTAMLRASTLDNEFFPTLAMQFRLLINPHATWLLLVPSVCAVLWGIWYYARTRQSWDWRGHGLLLVLVAILFSPYGGFSDEIVLLPAILAGLASPLRRSYATPILMALNTIALYVLLVHHAHLTTTAYLWTPIAWLTWFLYATWSPMRSRNNSLVAIAETNSTEA